MAGFLKTLVGVAAILATVGTAKADDKFRARLSGDAEVPPVSTDTTGKFKFDYDDFDATGEYRLDVREGVRITQAHLHCAPEGSNGPIVVFLAGFHNRGWDVDGKWINNATVTDANVIGGVTPSATCPETILTLDDVVQAMRNGNIYVNVHSVANPGGEIRGQVEEK